MRVHIDAGDIINLLFKLKEQGQIKREQEIAPLKQHIDTYGMGSALKDYPISDYADMWKKYESAHGKIPSKQVPIKVTGEEGAPARTYEPSFFKSLFGQSQFTTPTIRSLQPIEATPKQMEAQAFKGISPADLLKSTRAKLGLELAPAAEEKLNLTQDFQQKMLDQRETFQNQMFESKVKQVDDMYGRKMLDIEARDKWKSEIQIQRDAEREANRKELENLRQEHKIELDKIKGATKVPITGSEMGMIDNYLSLRYLPKAEKLVGKKYKDVRQLGEMLNALRGRDPLSGKYNIGGILSEISSSSPEEYERIMRIRARMEELVGQGMSPSAAFTQADGEVGYQTPSPLPPGSKLAPSHTPQTRKKGPGFLGTLPAAEGKVSTELSIGVNIDGREIEIPSLVPTLSKEEVNYLLKGGKPTKIIVDKAVAYARKRIVEGKSPFAQEGEQLGSEEKQKGSFTIRRKNF